MKTNTIFSIKRCKAICKKEIYHILRDPFTLTFSFVLPVILVLIFGFAIEFNLKNINTAYLNYDKSQTSRRLLETMGSSSYFKLKEVMNEEEGFNFLAREKAKAFIIIPPQLEKNILSAKETNIQVLVDGADNSSVIAILGYINTIKAKLYEKLSSKKTNEKVEVKTRFLFNSELNSKYFVVPGLVVIIMTTLSVLLTALTISKEWDNGSMELLLSTPVTPIEIVIGKLIPYATLSMIGVFIVCFLARLVFKVPFAGSYIIFIVGVILFLLAFLAQGLLISIVTKDPKAALQLAAVSSLIPSNLLSGFIFPIESMPKIFQILTTIFGARWFMVISRDQFLRASSFLDLKIPFIALLLIVFVLIFLSVKKFKRSLE